MLFQAGVTDVVYGQQWKLLQVGLERYQKS